MSGYSPKRKAVVVRDPMCAREYYISKAEFSANADEYRALGCEVIIGDQKVLL
jgi:hypothetical protein